MNMKNNNIPKWEDSKEHKVGDTFLLGGHEVVITEITPSFVIYERKNALWWWQKPMAYSSVALLVLLIYVIFRWIV